MKTFYGIAIAILTFVHPVPSFAVPYFNIPSDSLKQDQPLGKNTKPSDFPNWGVSVKKVVIDAGHGGHDPGCLGSGSYEKEIALGIALKLRAYISAQYPGVQVMLTRDTDVFIPLTERAQYANKNAADLFISVHCNYISKASHVQGSETYVLGPHRMEDNLQVALRENSAVLHEENYESIYGYDPNSPEAHIIMSMFQNAYLGQSILFAEKVEQHMHLSASRQSRGVKQAGFLVLRETTMPSVLIEAGFLSNSLEEKYLRTEEGQMEIASAIMKAFGDYKAEVEGTVVQTSPAFPEPDPAPAQTSSTIATSAPPSVPPLSPAPAPAGGVLFKIQLVATSKPVDTGRSPWGGLPYPYMVVEENGMFKYQIAAGGNLQEAMRVKQDVRSKGFPDAFITAYQDGRKITLDEAKRILGLE